MIDYPMYKTVEYYTKYADLRENPVHLYKFNFTSSFSTSCITNSYTTERNGASHMDALLYLFRFKAFDEYFEREEPETKMKDYSVEFVTDYVTIGSSQLYTAKPCRKIDMDYGFCDYLNIQRNKSITPNKVNVSVSNFFEIEMVKANKEVDLLLD